MNKFQNNVILNSKFNKTYRRIKLTFTSKTNAEYNHRKKIHTIFMNEPERDGRVGSLRDARVKSNDRRDTSPRDRIVPNHSTNS